jgi:hypothetical protein
MPSARRPPDAAPAPSPRGRRIALNVILGAAAVDGALLVALLYVAVSGNDAAVQAVGPLFGFGYIYLLYLPATGAVRRRWGWWYTGLVAVTLGPIGAVIGARRLQREDEERRAHAPATAPTRKERRKAAAEKRRAGGR